MSMFRQQMGSRVGLTLFGALTSAFALLVASAHADSTGMAASLREFAQQAEADETEPEFAPAVPGEFVVQFRPKLERVRQQAILQPVAERVRYFQRPRSPIQLKQLNHRGAGEFFDNLAIIKVPEDRAASALKQLKRRPEILNVEPNYRYRIAADAGATLRPNDFELDRLWGLENTGQLGGTPGSDIQAARAWNVSTGNRDVVVAVIDTGVDYYHPDLAENIWVNRGEIPGNGMDDDGNGYIDDVHGFDFISNDGDPMDDHVHGTHVAGTIGAVGNNRRGIAGICWEVGLMAVKAFDETGDGDLEGIVEAIQYSVANGARLINGSWGGSTRSKIMEEAIAEANRQGVLFVAALGNERTDSFFYPAAYAGVLAVAATDPKDRRAPFSNYGTYADIAAPGDNIFSTVPNNAYQYLSGTSMAAPHVSGVAALILSVYPHYSNEEIINILRNTADLIDTDRAIGTGRLNAYKAVQVSAPLPIARLDVPETVRGTIDLRGIVGGEEFAGYTLDYGKGARPTNWTELFVSAVAGEGGGNAQVLMAKFDTSVLGEGKHTIRLTAKNRNGQIATDRISVDVQNVQIGFPMSNDLLPADGSIEIRGTVFGAGRSYGIEFGAGTDPAIWSTDGITLVAEGKQQVVNGPLATWETAKLRPNEFYALRLTARHDGEVVGQHVVRFIYLDGLLKPGWPQYIPITGEHPLEDWRHVKVADLDGDGFGEVILVDPGNTEGVSARLLVFRHDGALWWSRTLASGEPYADIPVIGDIDGNGTLELFVDVGEQRQLFGFAHDGTPLPGNWPLQTQSTRWAKVIADLDGDGSKELIGMSQDPVVDKAQSQQLAVWNGKGELIRQWLIPECARTNDVPKIFPAVGNLDDDRDLEIVVVSGCGGLAAFELSNSDGPIWNAYVDGKILASPVIGDLDQDGVNEIVVGVSRYFKNSPGGLYVFRATGEVWPGWPVLTDQSFMASPALADIDGNGTLEISISSETSQKLFLVHHHGFPVRGWPVSLQKSYVKSSTVIGDVDGDSKPDVLLMSPGYWFLTTLSGDVSDLGGVKAWKGDGSAIQLNPNRSLPALLMEGSAGNLWLKASPPVLADLDGDGKLEVIAASIVDRAFARIGETSFRKKRSSIYVWELDVPFAPQRMPWPTFQGNAQHTGAFEQPPRQNEPPVVSEIPGQTIPVGATFLTVELDRYVEDPDDDVSELQWSVAGGGDLRVSIDGRRVATVSAPEFGWTGKEEIRFIATDPAGGTGSEAAVFEIRADYIPPLAAEDAVSILEDSDVQIDLLANDTHPSAKLLTVTHIGRPRFGRVKSFEGGRIVYVPNQDFAGTDEFFYTITDGAGGNAIGVVRVTVLPVNDPPAAVPDLAITSEDQPIEIDILANDTDPDGEPVVMVDFGQPENGKLVRSTEGVMLYTPNRDYHGMDSFTYKVRDPHRAETESTVNVMVKSVNDPPTVPDQTVTLNKHASFNLIFAGSDVESDKLTYKIVQSPENGVLLAYPDVANYAPKGDFVGQDQFTYVANDGLGDSREATVTLNVVDANNPPLPKGQSIKMKRNRSIAITLAAEDFDLDPLTFTILSFPKNGELTGTAPELTYRPNIDWLGTDRFQFNVTDGISVSEPTTISVEVTDRNTAPQVQDSGVVIKMNVSTNFVLLASDPESDPLEFTIVTEPANGTLSGSPPELVYMPAANFIGSDRMTFKASDGELESSVSTVTFDVKSPNGTPEISDQSITVLKDRSTTIRLAVEDADGDRLFTPILKGPRHGRLSGSGTLFQYRPSPGFVGADTFTYKVWDGNVYSKVGRVSIHVMDAVPEQTSSFESISVMQGGWVRLVLKTEPRTTYRIETSTNLVDWTPMITQEASGERTVFIDTNAGEGGARFYRARAGD